MTWADELQSMLGEAKGDAALFLGLVSLRRVENGGAGKEFGVISIEAPLYAQQLHTAAVSFRNHEQRVRGMFRTRALESGLYTDEFLTDFSHQWAPIGVKNDPNNLNANHAGNLIALYHRLSSEVLTTLLALPSGHEGVLHA